LRRGDIVTTALSGDYGKPRPAVVIQTDRVGITDTILVCLISSDIQDFSSIRINLPATKETGLERASQVMVEKIHAVAKVKCRQHIGRVPHAALAKLNLALFNMIGLGD
jgi:mRNA interferase MazF